MYDELEKAIEDAYYELVKPTGYYTHEGNRMVEIKCRTCGCVRLVDEAVFRTGAVSRCHCVESLKTLIEAKFPAPIPTKASLAEDVIWRRMRAATAKFPIEPTVSSTNPGGTATPEAATQPEEPAIEAYAEHVHAQKICTAAKKTRYSYAGKGSRDIPMTSPVGYVDASTNTVHKYVSTTLAAEAMLPPEEQDRKRVFLTASKISKCARGEVAHAMGIHWFAVSHDDPDIAEAMKNYDGPRFRRVYLFDETGERFLAEFRTINDVYQSLYPEKSAVATRSELRKYASAVRCVCQGGTSKHIDSKYRLRYADDVDGYKAQPRVTCMIETENATREFPTISLAVRTYNADREDKISVEDAKAACERGGDTVGGIYFQYKV